MYRFKKAHKDSEIHIPGSKRVVNRFNIEDEETQRFIQKFIAAHPQSFTHLEKVEELGKQTESSAADEQPLKEEEVLNLGLLELEEEKELGLVEEEESADEGSEDEDSDQDDAENEVSHEDEGDSKPKSKSATPAKGKKASKKKK